MDHCRMTENKRTFISFYKKNDDPPFSISFLSCVHVRMRAGTSMRRVIINNAETILKFLSKWVLRGGIS